MNLKLRAGYRASRLSSALIITLGFIVLITVLVIGFLASMRIERISARSHLNGIRADVFAQAGVDTAVARLYSVAANPNAGWISESGTIYVHTNGTTASPVAVPLYSGAPTATTTDAAVDLNPTSMETNQTLITGSTNSQPLYVSWIYQRQDGTTSTSLPAYDAANPVVGRYAFWTDDESGKLNVNTAGLRNNTNALSDPSSVNLNALSTYGVSGADISSIVSFTQTNNFNSAAELVRASPTLDTLYASQKFALTHYNHSPELNMFGQPRIMLTTSTNTAWASGSTNFLDILTTPNADPGLLANLDPAKVTKVMQTITNYMARTDWPVMPGHSFSEKYPDSGVTGSGGGIVQIAANIIDYVRCAESTSLLVEPLSYSAVFPGTSYGPPYSAYYPSQTGAAQDSVSLLGNARRVCIVEQGAYLVGPTSPFPTSGVTPGYTFIAFARLYLPPRFGVKSVPYDQINWEPLIVGSTSNADTELDPGNISSNDISDPTAPPPSSGLLAGHYVTVKRIFPNPVIYNTSYAYRGSLYDPNGAVMDRTMSYGYVAKLYSPAAVSNPSTVVLIEKTLDSQSCDDPCVNRADNTGVTGRAHNGDMYVITPGNGNQLRTQNPTLASTLASGIVTAANQKQDMEGGKPTSYSETLPTPKNLGGPGRVLSLGELGYIHTGMDVWPNGATGTPWRSLRLQPSVAADGKPYIPDWALLDLFCVPVVPGARSEPFLMPHSTNNAPIAATFNVGGRVNLNAGIQPFAASGLTRYLPLEAALLGATNTFNTNAPTTPTTTVSASTAGTLATNIIEYQQAQAAGIAANGRTFSTNSSGEVNFFTPAQIAEVKGIADTGNEDSEELVRQMLPVTTVRGNVFSIYTVGQSIIQQPNGTIQELGEKRYQVMVDRVGYGANTIFQPIYVKTIMP